MKNTDLTKAMDAGEYTVGEEIKQWFILPAVRGKGFPCFKAVRSTCTGMVCFYIEEGVEWHLVTDSDRIEYLSKLLTQKFTPDPAPN